jgi:probable blue pigment (indigoidine) exporter
VIPSPRLRHTRPAGSGVTSRAVVLTTALAPAAWGTTYLVTTELLPPDRPLLAGVLRALPAGLVLAAVTRERPQGAWWARALVLGTLNIGGFFALLFVAAYRLPGGVAATLGAVQPLVAAGLAALLLRERLRPPVVLAGLVGVVGVGLLVLRAGAELDGVGIAAGFAGAASMASGVVLTKRWGRPVPLLTFTTWQLVAGGLVLLPLALAVEGPPPALGVGNVVGYLWLGTVGTGVAYALWFRGIERLPVGQVSLLGLLSPIVATLAGWVVLGQHLAPQQLVGVVLVLGAMALGQRPPAQPQPLPQPGPCPPAGSRAAATAQPRARRRTASRATSSSRGAPPRSSSSSAPHRSSSGRARWRPAASHRRTITSSMGTSRRSTRPSE